MKFDKKKKKKSEHLFFATTSFVHHFVANGDTPETPNLGQNELTVWLRNLTYELERQ